MRIPRARLKCATDGPRSAFLRVGRYEISINRYLNSLLLAGTLLGPVVTTACTARVGVGYDYYDPYHRDYHHWDDNEVRFYNQWTVETHRSPGHDYNKLKHKDQREYWNWRHDHR